MTVGRGVTASWVTAEQRLCFPSIEGPPGGPPTSIRGRAKKEAKVVAIWLEVGEEECRLVGRKGASRYYVRIRGGSLKSGQQEVARILWYKSVPKADKGRG